MKQNINKTVRGLLGCARFAIEASKLHGDAIGLFHGSAPKMTIDRDALQAARDSYELGRIILRGHRDALNTKIDECREQLRLSRDVLKRYLGIDYNQRWDMTTLVRSIAIPKTPDELLVVLQGFEAYFTNNPAHENPWLNITASHMQTLFQELLTAINNVNTQACTVDQLLHARDEKAERLYKRIRICIEELSLLIDPLDPRWNAFGFNKPGAEQTPDAPEKIEVVVVNETTAMIEIPPTPRANYYRVYKRVIGVDAQPIAVGSPIDPNFTMEDLPRGLSIEFSVSAVNDGGESRLSDTVMITI